LRDSDGAGANEGTIGLEGFSWERGAGKEGEATEDGEKEAVF
jgi:hypothetical protein